MGEVPRVEERIAAVRQVSHALTAAGVAHALGGGALRWALGLADTVRDWDLTTDVDEPRVRAALHAFDVTTLPAKAPFRSAYALRVLVDGEDVEVIGRFAVATQGGVEAIATHVWGEAHGVPLADPRDWARAYRAMGRTEAADALEGYVAPGPRAAEPPT